MSALACQFRPSNSPAATAVRAIATTLDMRQLISLVQAAALLGMNADHLSRRCRLELEGKGLALFAAPPDGGQAKWWIHRSYDPRLMPASAGGADWCEPDLSGYTQRQRTDALARRACVQALREARRTWPGVTKDWMPRLLEQLHERFDQRQQLGQRTGGGLHISKSALYEWEQKYRRPADLLKLIDLRGGDQRSSADAAAWDFFRDLFLHANQPSLRQVWKLTAGAAKDSGWRWCSLHSCRRQLDKRIAPEVQLKHRDPKKWRQTLRPYIEQNPERAAAGELWIGDHKQLDLICRWRESLIRPWLTAWMDQRTRRIVGYFFSNQPDSSTILAALHHGLKDGRNFGGPRGVWIDNGKDYDAWLFHGQTKKQRRQRIKIAVNESAAHGIFAFLQIEPHFSLVENPNGKTWLERWFRTVENFCRVFDTYTGDAPDTKPERLNEILATPHRVPTFEQVAERLAGFIAGSNADADRSIGALIDDADGQRLSPDEAMARWCQTRVVMRDPKALDLLLMQWHRPVTVGRNGITLTLRGRAFHYGQFATALTRFKAASKAKRRPVNVAYDSNDLRSVRVHDEQFRYVCTVELNGQGGARIGDPIAMEHVVQLIRNKAQHEKSLKHVAEHSLTQCLTAEEQLADEAARQPRRLVAEQPRALRIRQTPLDGQAKEIERDQLRAAVGAESLSSRTPSHAMPSLERLRRNMTPLARRAPQTVIDPMAKARERFR